MHAREDDANASAEETLDPANWSEALALSHRIAVMNKGRVEQLDAPSKIYGFPRTRFVADFIGQCNLFSGPVAASGNATWTKAPGSRVASSR